MNNGFQCSTRKKHTVMSKQNHNYDTAFKKKKTQQKQGKGQWTIASI